MAGRPRKEATDHLTRRGVGAAIASLCVPSLAFTQSDTSIDTTLNLFTRVAALVRINGQGPFRFVIDTGAQRSAVADTVVSALALPAAPSVMIHGITSATLNSTAQVARLALANETFRNIQAPVLPLEQLGAHGLIGLDVLARFRVGFDTVGRRVTLVKPGGFRVVEGSAQIAGSNIRRRPSKSIRQRLGQLLLADTLAENVPVAAFIDTGAQYSIGNLALQRSIGAPTAGLATRPLSIRVYGVTGSPCWPMQGHSDRFDWGGTGWDSRPCCLPTCTVLIFST